MAFIMVDNRRQRNISTTFVLDPEHAVDIQMRVLRLLVQFLREPWIRRVYGLSSTRETVVGNRKKAMVTTRLVGFYV